MSDQEWDLVQAEAATQSIDLRHHVGLTVGHPLVVCRPHADDDPRRWRQVAAALRPLPVVMVAVAPSTTPEPNPATDWADLITDDPGVVTAAVHEHPQAATMAAQLLRHRPADASTGRLMESLAYATLQAGDDHRRWLTSRGRRVRHDQDPRVRLSDKGDHLQLTLTRGRLHNLMDHRMRDELREALITIDLDPDRRPVIWDAEGPTFCAGGDLAEFGTVANPAVAHGIRSTGELAPLIDRIADRLTAVVDGPCVGAGIELAALAGTISAGPNARFRLPELSLGLVPGAGGTWSIPGRIGRQRTLHWLVVNQELDADTARAWGLVDRQHPVPAG